MAARRARYVFLVGFILAGIPALALRAGTTLTTVRVTEALNRPVFASSPPGDVTRLFILEQKFGNVQILNLSTGDINDDPFLTISGLSTANEQGLLGLAFHPDYVQNGYFYLNYTKGNGDTVIERYTRSADPDIADSNSAHPILTIPQTADNHNGGWIGFGPNDSYLYIPTGDGGGSCDPNEQAQNLDLLLGKILRIDVNGDDFPQDADRNYAIPADNPYVGVSGDDEIWAFGLRNPWRTSFDRQTGDLYIADVGQREVEEINFQAADSTGMENYGWDCKEGSSCASVSTCDISEPGNCACADTSLVDPIREYSHTDGCAVTGGYVYRGCAIPDLQGTYFFADYCSDKIWSFRYDGSVVTEFQERTAELAPGGALSIVDISSFGEDAHGELYICDRGGEVFKIVPATPGPDSDSDGVVDTCDACAFEPALTEPSEPGFEVTCADGIDNDCDSLTDDADSNCSAPCLCGDFDQSGFVDLQDFSVVAA